MPKPEISPLEDRETLVAVLDFDLRGSNISNEEEGNPETEAAEKLG